MTVRNQQHQHHGHASKCRGKRVLASQFDHILHIAHTQTHMHTHTHISTYTHLSKCHVQHICLNVPVVPHVAKPLKRFQAGSLTAHEAIHDLYMYTSFNLYMYTSFDLYMYTIFDLYMYTNIRLSTLMRTCACKSVIQHALVDACVCVLNYCFWVGLCLLSASHTHTHIHTYTHTNLNPHTHPHTQVCFLIVHRHLSFITSSQTFSCSLSCTYKGECIRVDGAARKLYLSNEGS